MKPGPSIAVTTVTTVTNNKRTTDSRQKNAVEKSWAKMCLLSPNGGDNGDNGDKALADLRVRVAEVRLEELHLTSRDVLHGAPGPGIDHITTEAFRGDLTAHLHRLARLLRRGRFVPKPLRPSMANSRRVWVPTIADRIVARVLLRRLKRLVEALPESVVCRPGLPVRDAIARIAAARVGRWVVKADIRAAFPSTDLDAALAGFSERAAAAGIRPRVVQAVTAMAQPMRKVPEGGLPAGHPLSPLLLECYLADADEALASVGIRHWRYVDDILLVADSEGEAHGGLRLLADLLVAVKGLEIHPLGGKTAIVAPDEPIDFLSWELRPDGQHLVSAAAVDRVIAELAELPAERAAARLKGWISHFASEAGRERIEAVLSWLHHNRPETLTESKKDANANANNEYEYLLHPHPRGDPRRGSPIPTPSPDNGCSSRQSPVGGGSQRGCSPPTGSGGSKTETRYTMNEVTSRRSLMPLSFDPKNNDERRRRAVTRLRREHRLLNADPSEALGWQYAEQFLFEECGLELGDRLCGLADESHRWSDLSVLLSQDHAGRLLAEEVLEEDRESSVDLDAFAAGFLWVFREEWPRFYLDVTALNPL